MDLITKAEYKAYANITSINKDTEIDALIPRVSAFIKTYCRRSFVDYVTTPKTEHFNGSVEYFTLKEYPLIEVEEVAVSTDMGMTYTPLVEFADYVVDLSNENIHSVAGFFPLAINGYSITYKAGYTSVPEDLKLAVIDLITYYLRNDASIHSNKIPGTNAVQVEYITTTNLPAHIRRILDLYMADYT